MASTEKRGKTAHEAVLAYCTSWTQAAYRICWLDEGAGDATAKEKENASLVAARELMAMLRHEVPGQDDTASTPKPMRNPVVLKTGDLGSDSESEIKAGSFLGTYGVLDIDTAGHWTYRAGETRLRKIKKNGPDWFAHYDRFFVTREDGSVQTLTITLSRRRNDEVKETKAFPTVGDRVPAETFGENDEPDLRLATQRDLARKLPDPDQFDEPALESLWVEGKPDDGTPRREVTQAELRHLRFYPERDELSGGGLKIEGLLFLNATERLPVDETAATGNQKKSQRNSKHDVEADAMLRIQIEKVLAKARAKWPEPKTRPENKPMAVDLARDKKINFGWETIRKILGGNYKPMKRLGMRGL
jgi:VCBS repeat-containing protein